MNRAMGRCIRNVCRRIALPAAMLLALATSGCFDVNIDTKGARGLASGQGGAPSPGVKVERYGGLIYDIDITAP